MSATKILVKFIISVTNKDYLNLSFDSDDVQHARVAELYDDILVDIAVWLLRTIGLDTSNIPERKERTFYQVFILYDDTSFQINNNVHSELTHAIHGNFSLKGTFS